MYVAPCSMLWTPLVFRKALRAAGIVGSLLVAINQGDHLLAGQFTSEVIRRSLLTPVIPFCVTLFSVWLNTRGRMATNPETLRPGWPAIRRSAILALCVGSVILVVNQGHLLWAGVWSTPVLIKIFLTPCVPFCVSLYGAYVAYWNALQRP